MVRSHLSTSPQLLLRDNLQSHQHFNTKFTLQTLHFRLQTSDFTDVTVHSSYLKLSCVISITSTSGLN